MPLWCADSGDIALSRARGPSIMHPLICPRRLICVSSAASIVGGISGFTTSTAASAATLGQLTPNACASSTTFLIMSILILRSGYMLNAGSEMKKILSYPLTSWMYTCERVLPVRSPFSLFSIPLRKLAVATIPFMTICAWPLDTSSTALSAAAASPPFSSTTS